MFRFLGDFLLFETFVEHTEALKILTRVVVKNIRHSKKVLLLSLKLMIRNVIMVFSECIAYFLIKCSFCMVPIFD